MRLELSREKLFREGRGGLEERGDGGVASCSEPLSAGDDIGDALPSGVPTRFTERTVRVSSAMILTETFPSRTRGEPGQGGPQRGRTDEPPILGKPSFRPAACSRFSAMEPR
jgi:hypothetical protein